MRKFTIAAGLALALSSAPIFADHHPEGEGEGPPQHWQNVEDIAAPLQADLAGSEHEQKFNELMEVLHGAIMVEQQAEMHRHVDHMRHEASRISVDREHTQQEVQRMDDHINQLRSDLERMENDRNEMQGHITQMDNDAAQLNGEADALEAQANTMRHQGP